MDSRIIFLDKGAYQREKRREEARRCYEKGKTEEIVKFLFDSPRRSEK